MVKTHVILLSSSTKGTGHTQTWRILAKHKPLARLRYQEAVLLHSSVCSSQIYPDVLVLSSVTCSLLSKSRPLGLALPSAEGLAPTPESLHRFLSLSEAAS